MESFLLLAVKIAASFSRFARSAPVKPGVLLAMLSSVKSSWSFLFLACTSSIDSLPFIYKIETYIHLLHSNSNALGQNFSQCKLKLDIPEFRKRASGYVFSQCKVCCNGTVRSEKARVL